MPARLHTWRGVLSTLTCLAPNPPRPPPLPPTPQAPLLPGLLTTLTARLVAAEDSAMVQSLLCVLAQLLRADQQQLLDCLAGIRLG